MTTPSLNMVPLKQMNLKSFNVARHILSRTGRIENSDTLVQTVYIVKYQNNLYLAHYKQVEALCNIGGRLTSKMKRGDYTELWTVAKRLQNWNVISVKSDSIFDELEKMPRNSNKTLSIKSKMKRCSRIQWSKIQWLQM